MSKYQILLTGDIEREDGAVIPCDLNNRDYIDYLAWIESGGVSDVEIAPVVSNEEKRRELYVQRCDPLLMAVKGYELEGNADKVNATKALWLAERAAIRAEYPS